MGMGPGARPHDRPVRHPRPAARRCAASGAVPEEDMLEMTRGDAMEEMRTAWQLCQVDLKDQAWSINQ